MTHEVEETRRRGEVLSFFPISRWRVRFLAKPEADKGDLAALFQ
jgi:hypothetical protein